MVKTGIKHMDTIIDNVVRFVKSEDKIIAAGFIGSLATDGFSRLSDIDLWIITEDDDLVEVRNGIEEKAKKLPGFVIGDYYNLNFKATDKKDTYWCYLTDKLVNLDIFIEAKSNLIPWFGCQNMPIIKDKQNTLGKIKKKSLSKKETEPVGKKEFRHFLLSQRGDFIYAPLKFFQGSKREGIGNVKHVFMLLMDFKKRLEGVYILHYRKVEEKLSKSELELLDKINMLRPTKSDLKKGLELNWQLMKKLDRIYEKRHGKLDLKEFDKRLWNCIDELLNSKY